MSTSVVIPEGNAIRLSIDWHDMDGETATPDSVVYQVFDKQSGDAVSDQVTADDPEEITVDGDDMPTTSERTRLVIQVRGTFGTDQHTEFVDVVVRRGYTFS